MKKKEKTSLANMTIEELQKFTVDVREKIIKAKNESQKNQTKNTRQLRALRKQIAVALSIIRQKELSK